ncbi:MAG: outer membrane lipoprotein carrier protein LolA [Thermoflexibacter sp.]|jgi:outer membrane lipoprotein-sorting protein|nr:outer membrane lipoprotein carrier protein LolA [Thermoflexibacter sp.]
MRKLSFLLFALIGIVGNILAQSNKDPKVEAVLNGMSERYKTFKSFQADFTYTIESTQEKIKDTQEGSIIVKGEKFRLNIGEQEIFNNMSTVWTYLKGENEVTITDYDPDGGDITPAEVYTMYKKGFKYTFADDVTDVDTKIYDVVDLIPEDRNLNYFKVRLVIDKKTKDLKSWKVFEKNGRRFLYTIVKFVPNVVVKDSDFTFDKNKYPKVTVIDLR